MQMKLPLGPQATRLTDFCNLGNLSLPSPIEVGEQLLKELLIAAEKGE